MRALAQEGTDEQMKLIGQLERKRMESVQCYAGIRGSHNIAESSDVPGEKMKLYEKLWWTPVHQKCACPRRDGSCCAGRTRAWRRRRA
jgi:aminopeptidase